MGWGCIDTGGAREGMSMSWGFADWDTGLLGAPREVFSGAGMGNEAACGVRGVGACEA